MNFIKFVASFLLAVITIFLANSCSTDTYNYDLDIRNKYWKLTEMEGDTVIALEGQKEPHVIFKLNEEIVKGSGGCNNFTGTYILLDDSVQVEGIAITRKYCDTIMEVEDKFMSLLGVGGRYRISNETLELFSNNKIKAKFKAIYF